jgi:hypothetical protein
MMDENEFPMYGKELEEFLKKEFSFNDSLKRNLEKVLSISNVANLVLEGGKLSYEQFNEAVKSYKDLAKEEGYSMKIECSFPPEARISTNNYMHERKTYKLMFKKSWIRKGIVKLNKIISKVQKYLKNE